MQRIEVHPDVLDEKARFVQQKKQELERMVWELEKSIYLLQSDWSGVTGERFFWDFMQVKEVFPTTLGLLDKIQNEFTFVAKNFRTTDGSGEVALYIPEELKPTFAKGLADGSVGETVTGFGQTLEAFIYSPLSTAGSLAYAFTLGKAVDAGRGIKFAWDAYWGNGTARSDVEQFVEDQKKQIDQDGLGYYSGSMAGQVLAYALFGRALHSVENKHSDVGGAGGGKPEAGKGKTSFGVKEVIAPSSGKAIKVYTDEKSIIPIDKIEKYMRGKVNVNIQEVTKELRELKQMRQSQRKVFDANPENAERIKRLESMKHNYERSQDMGSKLEFIGLGDTKENNEIIAKHLLQIGEGITPDNRMDFPSVLEGTDGKVKVLSTWSIVEGKPYLSTIKIIPIKN